MSLLALALLAAGSAPENVSAASLPACAASLVGDATQVDQGGLQRGRLPPGTQLLMQGATPREVRVDAAGAYVFGVARDASGPVVLQVTPAGAPPCAWTLAVAPRAWAIERIEGVPEATVNPPPAIAARIEREQAAVAKARERDDDRDDFSGGFDWPVTGRVSGVYGSQRVYNGTPKSPHSGLDVAAPKGTPLLAPAPGIVTFAEPDLYLTGGTVLLDHGHGLSSSFLHLSRIDVAVGQRVERGERIGLVGATGRATGPHMHWGMNWFDVRVDPQPLLDPLRNPQAPAAGATPSR